MILMAIFWVLFKIRISSPFNLSKNDGLNFFFGGIFIAILFAVLALLFKKRELEQFVFTEREIKLGNRIVMIYFLGLIILLTTVLILHAKNVF